MNIDKRKYPSKDVCSLLDHTGNDTGHSKQEIQYPQLNGQILPTIQVTL